jgi:hypothetical protein
VTRCCTRDASQSSTRKVFAPFRKIRQKFVERKESHTPPFLNKVEKAMKSDLEVSGQVRKNI